VRESQKRRFRPGAGGACEASLFIFTGKGEEGEESSVARIAATDMEEALAYMRARYSDFQIVRAEFVGMVRMLSGTPVD
jgi:hypothetical protein